MRKLMLTAAIGLMAGPAFADLGAGTGEFAGLAQAKMRGGILPPRI